MIIEPKIRGFICTTAHPTGCAQSVLEQMKYVKENGVIQNGPKKVLVIGASTGYGLATRIMTGFGCQAATIGVFFERPPDQKRTATAGWYNSVAFEREAKAAGLYAKSFNGDAFSDEMRQKVIETIKKDLGKIDLIIYSLASPRRQHPKTGAVAKSVLKPINTTYTNQSINLTTDKLETVTLSAATQTEINETVSVMGGEDWELWMDALQEADVLADGVLSVAYSYVGPEITRGVYRNGTIGKAKQHLEATAQHIDARLKKLNGRAVISVNKALVTQSSSAIPFIPLYFILLSKVMKKMNVHENCIAQICRLFTEKLYAGKDIAKDKQGLVRVDDLEMRKDVQDLVQKHWDTLTEETIKDFADLEGYHNDFLQLFGFGFSAVDYNMDVDPDLKLPSATS